MGIQDFPLLQVELTAGCSMLAEPGRLIQLPKAVKYEVVMGNGEPAGMFATMGKALSRVFSGESMFLARFTNEDGNTQILRFGTVIPGNLIPLKLSDWGGSIICSGGAFFCSSDRINVESCFRQSLGAAFFGGESFILQKISGEGSVILQGGGAVLKEKLTPERPCIRIDTGCLVAFTEGLEYSIDMAPGGLKGWFFGGEGIFLATVSLKPGQAEGTVWVESFPYTKFLNKIKSTYPH